MRRFTDTQLKSLLVAVVAAVITLHFEAEPRLLKFLDSAEWTRLIEWFCLTVMGLVLLAWMGFTDMEFDVISFGIKARRAKHSRGKPSQARADEGAFVELRKILEEERQDNRRLVELARELQRENARLSGGISGESPIEDDEDQRERGDEGDHV